VLSEPDPTPERHARAVASQLLPDPLMSDDLVGTIAFLASAASDPVTGQVCALASLAGEAGTALSTGPR
jgi:hypothetical protein